MLAETIRKHQSRAIEAAQVIEELIGLAKQMRESAERGEKLHLTDDEVAFYGALEVNDSAVKVLGDETLRTIARELVETVRKNTTIDWTVRENIRAHLRVLVKRILRKYGYPPDKQEKATLTVLEQAEVLSANWATAEDVDLKAHVATISGCARAAHPTARSRNAFSWSSAQMRALALPAGELGGCDKRPTKSGVTSLARFAGACLRQAPGSVPQSRPPY